jgi:phosphotransacetylase/acyl dehydratase
MEYIENRTFDEIRIGDSASLVRTLSRDDIELFAVMSGDVNPAHLDEEYARSEMFHKVIAHGMWGGTLISALLGTTLPGPGTIYLSQELRFRRPVGVGDTITVAVTAREKDEERHRITFDCVCSNQLGEAVITGTALVIAPTQKVKRPRVILPEVHLYDHGAHLRRLIESATGLEPIRAAVAYPADRDSLLGAIDPAEAGLIVPVLVGPETRIRAAAAEAGVDISPYEIVPADRDSADERVVALARAGEVEAVLKGGLRTSVLLRAVSAPRAGIQTERRMSHVWVMDIPTYSRPLLLTDAVVNVSPPLEDKADIVQNAIALAHVIGIDGPKVAILSASETVSSKIQSSLDAAALCKMVDRGQISGGLVDGPLGFDNAVSEKAARSRGIVSPVAGQADVLVAPDLESGVMLVKQLEYMARAQNAGIIMGARVPVVQTSRAYGAMAHVASCALAVLLAHHRRGRP